MKLLQRIFSLLLVHLNRQHEHLLGAYAAEIQNVDANEWFQDCFRTFEDKCCAYSENDPHIKYSNHDLIDSPSGLCADHLACAFTKCNGIGFPAVRKKIEADTNGILTYDDVKDNLGTLNLPAKISFPKLAADIVAGVNYAKDNGMKVSIKSTGHSYTGSSTIKDSLQMNLRDLKTYTDESIVECNGVLPKKNPNFRACTLAQARGKEAMIKVGGGEVWSNVYVAMKDKVDSNGTALYEAVGGGAGSVGAAGGWLQGGGWSYGPERMYGLGVDQVLEFEMVLADGRHVLFGPTSWENATGFVYPKTKEVSGKCNVNVDATEDQWEWVECAEPAPPFADLWFAVRGGGGGTYGIVTSLKYQLHKQKPMEVTFVNNTATDAILATPGVTAEIEKQIAELSVRFLLKMLYAPEEVGLTTVVSNKCGSPKLNFNPFDVYRASLKLFCYDNVFQDAMLPAWRAIVESEAAKDANIFMIAEPLGNIFSVHSIPSYPDLLMSTEGGFDPDITPAGKVSDDPLPSFFPDMGYGGWCTAQIPKAWLAEAGDDVLSMLLYTSGEHVTGGNVSIAHDQMTAITPTARSTGLTGPSLVSLDNELQHRILESVLKDSSDDTNTDIAGLFPGMTEVNHVCVDFFGPLKSDMTKLCPIDYSLVQKEELCYSIQESIWGTETLGKLETIKAAVDPDNIFDCYACVKPRTTSRKEKGRKGKGKEEKKSKVKERKGKERKGK